MPRRSAPLLLLLAAPLSGCGSRSALFDETPPASSPPDAAPPPADAGVLPGLVLFGGIDPTSCVPPGPAGCPGTLLGDTWVWDARGWTKRDLPGPGARAYHAIASWGRGALLYGGQGSGSTVYSDTWQWDGVAWHPLAASSGPSTDVSTIVPAMAELGGKVVAYAVKEDPSASLSAATWEWDGASWTEKSVPSPTAATTAVMATLGDRVVWEGKGETWTWDGAGWTQVDVPSPSATDARMAPLAATLIYFATPVFFPTLIDSGTVTWGGGGWKALDVTPPRSRTNAAMAATPSEVILFGGVDPYLAKPNAPPRPLADTWAWDGRTWTERPGAAPGARAWAAMAAFQGPASP